MFHGIKSPADAHAKIAHLTSVFEKLVAEAGERRRQIEQLLNEIAEEHEDAKILSGVPAPTLRKAA
jgi:hypothetical protein